MVDETKEWPEWTDRRGNVYRPGDEVAYATVSGSSGHLVIGHVEKINKVNSKGQPHETYEWDGGDYALKTAYDTAYLAASTCGLSWTDPNRKPYDEARDNAWRAWNDTRQRLCKPSATVRIDGSTIKNLHNIIKL